MRGCLRPAAANTGALRSMAVTGNLLAGKSCGPCQGTTARKTSGTTAYWLNGSGAAEKSCRQSRRAPTAERRLKPGLQPSQSRLAAQAQAGAATMTYKGTCRAEASAA